LSIDLLKGRIRAERFETPDDEAVSIEPAPFAWVDPRTIPPREWLYGRHLIRKFLSVTVAPGGVGKSALIIVESLAMASGRDLLGVRSAGRLKVWLWNGEDPLEELQRRVAAAALHYELDRSELEGRLFLNSGRDTPLVIATEKHDGVQIAVPVVEALKKAIRRYEIDVLVIDPFVSSHAISENDNMRINAVKNAYMEVAQEGCAIELVHHARKLAGAEMTVEHSRGAVALIDGSRSARVLNPMSKSEGEAAGIENHRFYFRVSNGKASMSPPLDKSDWFRHASIDLNNGPLGTGGDSVGVVTKWTWPDPFEGIGPRDLKAAQNEVAKGRWRENVQAKDWVGIAIARAMKLDPTDSAAKTRIKQLLKTWIANGMFVVVQGKDNKGNDRPFVEVGEWATD
jgi:hypothetical protein